MVRFTSFTTGGFSSCYNQPDVKLVNVTSVYNFRVACSATANVSHITARRNITGLVGICPHLRFQGTLKSLIEEHACLDFSDFLSTLLAIFYVVNEKFPPACLLIYLVNKQAGWHFFPSLLVYSGLLFY